MAFATAPHSGECCGVSCLYGFPSYSEAYMSLKDRIDMIRKLITARVSNNYNQYCENDEYSPETARHCIEVVLTTSQIPEWGSALADIGFVEVFSFLNSNSDNICHVFMLETNRD